MNIEVKNIKGESVEEIEIRDDVFGVPMNSVLVHQVVVGQLANARQGTAKAKTRSEVSGGGRKPRPSEAHRIVPSGFDSLSPLEGWRRDVRAVPA